MKRSFILPCIWGGLILTTIGCETTVENGTSSIQNYAVTSTKNIESTPFELGGTWALTNYFDTIVKHKELAKYRLQRPTWFSIILDIENDTINAYGSIEHSKLPLGADTLAVLHSGVAGSDWALTIEEPHLKLVQLPGARRIDSTIYLFRKRDEFSNFTSTNLDFFTIGNNVTQYFNESLLAGTYRNHSDADSVVMFKSNGEIYGLEGFDSYAVRNYFGTLHMHKNLDVVTFRNSETRDYAQYHWLFENDRLILTEFEYEIVTFNGETYEGDYLIPGDNRILLSRQ